MTEPAGVVPAQYLTFILDNEVYATEIGRVREVLEYSRATPVPRAPAYMRGVTNLRGRVLPVLDLRLKLGLGRTPDTPDTCIIIVDVPVDGEETVLGVLADSVQEVLDLDPSQIQPAPKIGTRLRNDFISGMGKRDDRFIILLDMVRIFSKDEIAGAAVTAGVEEGTGECG